MAEEKKQEETTEEKAPEVAAEAHAEEPNAAEAPVEAPAEAPKEEVKPESVEAPKEEAKEAAPEEEKAEEPAEEATAEPEPVVEGDFVMAGVALKPGLTVRIHQRINEGEKSRIQVFEGMILKLRGATPETKTVTVRKIATGGVGVEKIIPLALPSIEKVELVKEAKVRRSKLYYLRDHKKKLRETLLT